MVAAGFNNVTAGISAGRKMIRAMGDEFSEAVYGVKWVNGYAVYAACEKQEVKKLESYISISCWFFLLVILIFNLKRKTECLYAPFFSTYNFF